MADDINDGGTQDEGKGEQGSAEGQQNQEGTLYTQEAIDALVLEKQKEAVTKTWGDMQSRADKAISAATTETKTAKQQLADLKRSTIEALPPEQKQAAMLEEVYAKMNAAPEVKPQDGASDSQTQTQGQSSTFQPSDTAPSDAQAKAQEAVGKRLQEKGLDPSKINFGDGKDADADLNTFVDSMYAQVKSSLEQGDSTKEKQNYDNSRGTGTAGDLLTADPVELMKRGYKDKNWRKRGGDF